MAWLPPAMAAESGPLDEDGYLSGSTQAPAGRKGPQKAKTAEDLEIEKILQGRIVDSVSVDMVMVPAVVSDRKGRPITDLDAGDFTLLEDGRPQVIEYFAIDRNEPISVAFLLDVSGSMRISGSIGTAKEAVRYFLSSLRSQDEAALIAFADRQVAMLTDFSASRGEALKYLTAVRAYGQTALNDAVAAAPDMVHRELKGRKAIVLLTDGVDNYSTLSLDAAMAAARAVDVPFYTIGFATHGRELHGDRAPGTAATEVLKMVAAETGGTFFLIHDPDEMKEAVARIDEDLRSQYVIGYSPQSVARDGRFRKITLLAEEGRYSVRARSGYILAP